MEKTIARPDDKPTALQVLTAILEVLRRIERSQDEYARTNLNARYPYGQPTDRWRRRA